MDRPDRREGPRGGRGFESGEFRAFLALVLGNAGKKSRWGGSLFDLAALLR